MRGTRTDPGCADDGGNDVALGRVILVGGGPGPEDLLTLRAVRALESADVIFHDRIGPNPVLASLPQEPELVDVGKRPGDHPTPQWRINELIVEAALAGRTVVRLKGGDPFVLGRGGEEWVACLRAGVPVEVVPGVSALTAGPAAIGVPLTHRGLSTGLLMISGHEDIDVSHLVAWPHTIAVLMGMKRLPALCLALVAAGKAADTPVAVVQDAWGEAQQQVHGTLTTIADQVRAHGIANPAVIVIGGVAAGLTEAS